MNAFAVKRIKAGLNQEEVAKALQLDRSTVAKWETDKAYPRSVLLPQLAKLYNCSIDELLAGKSDDEAV